MNVFVLIYSLSPGGAERVTTNLANHWAKRGHTVQVVTLAGRGTDHYVLDPGVSRLALHVDAESHGALQAVGNNLQRLKAIRKVLKECKPDIAVGMMGQTNCLLGLAAMGMDLPIVGSERIHPPHLPLGFAWEYIRRRVYPRLTCIVAQTEESAGWLRKHTGARHVVVIPNPVEYPLPLLEPHVVPPSHGMRNIDGTKRRLLLSVGRATPQKGFDRLIEAFAALAGDLRDWDLAIIGDGVGRSKLEGQVQALGLAQRVLLPGRVGNIGDWYAAADLFALTSRFEGFPNVLLEALAYNLPAVAVDCQTGPRDLIRHEIDGLLVPQDDQHALSEALARLMRDGELRAAYGRRAGEVRERFAMDNIGGVWEGLFEELVFATKDHGST